MTIETLITAKDKIDTSFLENIELCTDAVVVNQCDRNDKFLSKTLSEKRILFLCTTERGLSKSRNAAINNATADICVLSDDGFIHINGYDKIVEEAYTAYPHADIITFQNVRHGKRVRNYSPQPYKHNIFTLLSVLSNEITFRPESLKRVCIKFDEKFGEDSVFEHGEEFVFLGECLKRELSIYYIPAPIGALPEIRVSQLLTFDKNYFVSKGASFKAVGGFFAPVLSLYFAIGKFKAYRNQCSFFKALSYLSKGGRAYKKVLKKGIVPNG